MLPTVAGNEPSFVVGTVGRIQAVKEHRTLLSAFAEMLRAMPSLRPRALLAIIGDGPLLGELRNQAATLGIADQVWLPGSRSDVAEILRSLDVFVLPSLNEGISNTILEAMATGLPVIATDVGGNPELVEEGITGHLLPARDSDALGHALVRFAGAAGESLTMGRAGRQRAERFFSLDGMVADYTALYERLLQGHMGATHLPVKPGSTRVSTRSH
ncbi:MAG TPA: glycosyltransferase [Casimicrobiaceae bacterium]|nr:glycosyltransferase [Casimicrobiaceae bacterium]